MDSPYTIKMKQIKIVWFQFGAKGENQLAIPSTTFGLASKISNDFKNVNLCLKKNEIEVLKDRLLSQNS